MPCYSYPNSLCIIWLETGLMSLSYTILLTIPFRIDCSLVGLPKKCYSLPSASLIKNVSSPSYIESVSRSDVFGLYIKSLIVAFSRFLPSLGSILILSLLRPISRKDNRIYELSYSDLNTVYNSSSFDIKSVLLNKPWC